MNVEVGCTPACECQNWFSWAFLSNVFRDARTGLLPRELGSLPRLRDADGQTCPEVTAGHMAHRHSLSTQTQPCPLLPLCCWSQPAWCRPIHNTPGSPAHTHLPPWCCWHQTDLCRSPINCCLSADFNVA